MKDYILDIQRFCDWHFAAKYHPYSSLFKEGFLDESYGNNFIRAYDIDTLDAPTMLVSTEVTWCLGTVIPVLVFR